MKIRIIVIGQPQRLIVGESERVPSLFDIIEHNGMKFSPRGQISVNYGDYGVEDISFEANQVSNEVEATLALTASPR